GYLPPEHTGYLDDVRRSLRSAGLEAEFTYRGEVDRAQKVECLHELDVLSVPTTYKEPKGLFVLEALANGVPVVQPRHGAFPELIEATGGGLLVDPESPEDLARGIEILLRDPERRRELGRHGREAVHERFNDRGEAERMLRGFGTLLSGQAARRATA